MMKRALGLYLVLAIFPGRAPASLPSQPEKKKPVVVVDKIESTQLFDLLTYPARLIPKINASVLSEVEGVVQRIHTPLGTQVAKGATLLVVRNTDPVYEYAPARVRAPVAGVVSEVVVTEGSRVARGQRLIQITDPTQVRITVEVAVSDLSAIRAGLEGELTVAGIDGKLPVRVTGVSPYVDPGTGTATAELALGKSAEVALPPGLVGKVAFKARSREGIQIPEHAVAYRGREPYVRVVQEGKTKFLPVTLGPTRQGMVEVLKGLQGGMNVVLRSSAYVADGEAVEVQALKPAGRSE